MRLLLERKYKQVRVQRDLAAAEFHLAQVHHPALEPDPSSALPARRPPAPRRHTSAHYHLGAAGPGAAGHTHRRLVYVP